MNQKLDKIKKMRLFVLQEIRELTVDELNRIPERFNNNIIWNLGHLVAAMQAICYMRASLSIAIPERNVAPYLTNTQPANVLGSHEIDEIKALLISTVDLLQKDVESNIFSSYSASPNIAKQYDITLTSIEHALEFLLYHEGYHTGCILALKRFVKEEAVLASVS